ncbi:hypothetical protein SBA4_4920005 [Candidatus Sulfopaludibacter sp. SbA4]|nr:hypothetical protein SBA4_4920005 [Candidatus Sulfopaludibacter sp. SbA4]
MSGANIATLSKSAAANYATRIRIMSDSTPNLEQLFDRQIQNLALTRRPSTMRGYRVTAHRFLVYLRASAPQLQQVGELRRDPHLLGWFRSLAEQQPPLSSKSRWSHLLLLRRLLEEVAVAGYPVADQLIRREDFPPLPVYLPRALPLEDDRRLQEQLRRSGSLGGLRPAVATDHRNAHRRMHGFAGGLSPPDRSRCLGRACTIGEATHRTHGSGRCGDPGSGGTDSGAEVRCSQPRDRIPVAASGGALHTLQQITCRPGPSRTTCRLLRSHYAASVAAHLCQ